MKIVFGDFLQVAFDIFKPRKKKRMKDAEIEKVIKPYIDDAIKDADEHGNHGSGVASTAWWNFKKSNK